MSHLVNDYVKGLAERLPNVAFIQLTQYNKVTDADIDKLLNAYPKVPESLILLIKAIGKKCFNDSEENCLTLGSDIHGYPYYLLPIDEILGDALTADSLSDIYADYITEIDVSDKIDIHTPLNHYLCFAHCMNNGGTSQLYIDFTPSQTGTVGQIIRFLHDPDNYEVLSDSFDDYLQKLMELDYNFISQ